MNEKVYERIVDVTPYILRLLELDEKEYSWIRELLKNGRTVLKCLELLDLIEAQSLNYTELSGYLNCSPETAKQRLNAMIAGGLPVLRQKDERFITSKGGRSRKLARRKENETTDS